MRLRPPRFLRGGATGLLSLALAILSGGQASARQPGPGEGQITPVPSSILLPNYNRLLIGEKEALEAAAFVARADGAIAAYYNPAGLGLARSSSLTAGLSTQEWINYSVAGSIQDTSRTANRSLGGVFGVVLGPDVVGLEKWRLGFLLMRPVSIKPALELTVTSMADGTMDSYHYVTASSLSDFAPTIAAAYNYSPTLRFGGSLRVSNLSLTLNQTQFIDRVTESGVRTIEGTLFGNGGVTSLVMTGGIQWEPHPALRVGTHVIMPSVRLAGSSSLIFRGARLSPEQDELRHFSDGTAEFRYRQPFGVSAGVAWVFDRGALEFDLKHYAPTGTYDVFRSDQPIRRTTATTDQVVVTEEPLAPVRYSSRAVTNISLGGRFRFGDALTAHAGVYTDRSPVAPGIGLLFARIDSVGFSGGAAVNVRGLVGSVGLAYLVGDQQVELELPTGQAGPTVRVGSLQLLYAVSFSF